MKSLLFICALAGAAHAFPTGLQFDGDPLTSDGGGGIAFTGASRFAGHTCVVCHTDPPGTIGLKLEADHPELFTDGWVANTQYQMRVVMLDEHADAQNASLGDNCGFNAATYTPCDVNGFALEMDDANGNPVGSYALVTNAACVNTGTPPTDTDAVVTKDGTAVVHNGAHAGLTAWSFCWTAPKSGTGTITAFVAEVDGNGGDGTMNFPQDTIGDDVFAGAVPIVEKGATTPSTGSGGCNAGGPGLLGVAFVIALIKRKRFALAMLLVMGCTHVRATQRETLARRNMKFAPDPAEDELDLHMEEAREGSSGGYGSSGGGCGCN